MQEKKFFRWILSRTVIIVSVFLIITTVLHGMLDHTYKAKSMNLTRAAQSSKEGDPFVTDGLLVEMDQPDIIEFIGFEQHSDKVYWVMKPIHNASGQVFLTVKDGKTGEILDETLFKVIKHGLIIDMETGDFTHCRVYQLCMVLFVALIACMLWVAFVKSIRWLRYSYQSIFCAGLGIWVINVLARMLAYYVRDSYMIDMYQEIENAASNFAYITFPLLLVFAVLMSLSNISLIRHEGFRVKNILGCILSITMILGFVFLCWFSNLNSSGNDFRVRLWSAISEIMWTAYAIMECFLMGSIICGTIAARHDPSYDKDYIVILGCQIRKDGTLYPLIRGRVDRAIRFYHDQFNATGKKAVFIPSGGQGSDEIISEGEAMQRYLISQGIEASQIVPEIRSVNTRQNMQFSMELMKEGSAAAFSTTNYHVFRSGIISRQVEFEADGMGSSTKWYFWPNAYAREVVGMLSYKWKSLVLMFLPIVSFLTVIRFTF